MISYRIQKIQTLISVPLILLHHIYQDYLSGFLPKSFPTKNSVFPTRLYGVLFHSTLRIHYNTV